MTLKSILLSYPLYKRAYLLNVDILSKGGIEKLKWATIVCPINYHEYIRAQERVNKTNILQKKYNIENMKGIPIERYPLHDIAQIKTPIGICLYTRDEWKTLLKNGRCFYSHMDLKISDVKHIIKLARLYQTVGLPPSNTMRVNMEKVFDDTI